MEGRVEASDLHDLRVLARTARIGADCWADGAARAARTLRVASTASVITTGVAELRAPMHHAMSNGGRELAKCARKKPITGSSAAGTSITSAERHVCSMRDFATAFSATSWGLRQHLRVAL